VIWHGDTLAWQCSLSESDVAATLSVFVIPDLSQGSHDLAPEDPRQGNHTRRSTNSSVIDGGIDSSCFSRLSLYAEIASLMPSTTSSLVCPCEMLPGKTSISAT
jgi:hypothetical protein